MSATLSEHFRKLLDEIAEAPQDAQKLIQGFIAAKDRAGGLDKLAANVVGAVAAANAKAVNEISQALILQFIWLKMLNDCLTMIRRHPTRLGVNDEISRRFLAATDNASAIVNSLGQLFDAGGVSVGMEAQLVVAQQVALLKSQLQGAQAAEDQWGRANIPLGDFDQLLNYNENQVTVAILKKLIEQEQSDPSNFDFTILFLLQPNRLMRIANVKTIYEASGRSLNIIYSYYRNFRKFINDLPANRPFDLSFSMSFSNSATP